MANELILIVEDNPKNLKLVRDILQVKGYKTVEAETGEEGVRLAHERLPALILMDIQLPGMSGIGQGISPEFLPHVRSLTDGESDPHVVGITVRQLLAHTWRNSGGKFGTTTNRAVEVRGNCATFHASSLA